MLKPAPLIAVFLLACPISDAAPVADDTTVSFTRDIRPILSNNCFHCHGPDENTREAELRLDTKTGLLGNGHGGPVIAGDPEASELLRRMMSHDSDEQMPPPDSGKQLDDAQKQMIRLWIRQGAPWEQHWSFRQPILPDVPAQDNAWCRNEIDQFILRKLRAAQLTPAAPAAPAVQLRRLFLDLTGVPPTIEQADHWRARIWPDSGQAETGHDAEWEALVDELMSSPRYGERWARRWLDLARYADTNGYEKDRDRSIWPYRDWVVDAINANMPFDRFTIEQLAGDMLPNATQQQRIATGFHRNTMLNEEGGIDPLEFRYHAMTDRVATTGTTWLGLTLGCCQCHTHKYDP
ncbi:MAG: DUF1549 domain-containing protein, partial [Planctomycetaceae bacterium]|nr:DUF1549 domain-containing protein [Planctomycetaceae bacterium]